MTTFHYTIHQNGESVSIAGLDDAAMREKAHRIAQRSLGIDSGEVRIMRQVGNGKRRTVAVLGRKDRVKAPPLANGADCD